MIRIIEGTRNDVQKELNRINEIKNFDILGFQVMQLGDGFRPSSTWCVVIIRIN